MSRAAKSLDVLLKQINSLAPTRSRISDGGAADDRHLKAGTSDHIPRAGVFHARDFTHDPEGGFDSYAFADRLLASQDGRLAYVISNGRIGSGPAGPNPGRWRAYDGENAHRHHVHVSVRYGAIAEKDDEWSAVRPRKNPTLQIRNQEDELNQDERKLLDEAVANSREVLIQLGGRRKDDGSYEWPGWTTRDETPRKLTVVDLLREIHRETNVRLPGPTGIRDTVFGHVLNLAKKVGAGPR